MPCAGYVHCHARGLAGALRGRRRANHFNGSFDVSSCATVAVMFREASRSPLSHGAPAG